MHTAAAQAGEVRSAIGSAMLHLGVPPGAMVGLYSVNCPGGWPGHQLATCVHIILT